MISHQNRQDLRSSAQGERKRGLPQARHHTPQENVALEALTMLDLRVMLRDRVLRVSAANDTYWWDAPEAHKPPQGEENEAHRPGVCEMGQGRVRRACGGRWTRCRDVESRRQVIQGVDIR